MSALQRRSPPAAPPASSASIRRSGRLHPEAPSYAASAASTTPGPRSMLPWTETPAPLTDPAHPKVRAPVKATGVISRATTAYWRASRPRVQDSSGCGSKLSAVMCLSTAVGVAPEASSSRPTRRASGLVLACAAMTPSPGINRCGDVHAAHARCEGYSDLSSMWVNGRDRPSGLGSGRSQDCEG